MGFKLVSGLDEAEIEVMRKRYEGKVERRGEDECWGWKGQRDENGYGKIRRGKQTNHHSDNCIRAHRFAYEIYVRRLKDGELVLHHCDNPSCTNYLKHLYAGTHKDNHGDARARGRRKPARGEQVASAMLTEAKVREIRRLAESGEWCSDIAREIGCRAGVVWDVIRGKTWKYLGPVKWKRNPAAGCILRLKHKPGGYKARPERERKETRRRITEEQEEKIKGLLRVGEWVVDIAREVGCEYKIVGEMARGMEYQKKPAAECKLRRKHKPGGYKVGPSEIVQGCGGGGRGG